jgi:dethiobiotin synthetase
VSRPRRLVVVTGTGTAIGKTWVGARLLTELGARGRRVAARKPAQSFEPGTGPTDAEVLAAATGEDPRVVTPPQRWYGVPLAPPMAARALGLPSFTVADLLAEVSWPDPTDVGLVEGIGGPRSPLADDGDTVDLTAALRPELVVVVAGGELGAINSVRLTAAPFAGLASVVVALNRYDETSPVQVANRAWLSERAGIDVETEVAPLADRLG